MHLLIVSYSLMLLSSILHALLPLPLCKKSEKEFSITLAYKNRLLLSAENDTTFRQSENARQS